MLDLKLKLKNKFRPYKRKLQAIFRRMSVAPAVIQVYVGGDYETRYTLVNFPSLYSPLKSCACFYDVELYGDDGECFGKGSLELKPYGSVEVIPSMLFKRKLPDYGFFSAKIRPQKKFVYRHLGQIRSHIYALISDPLQTSFVLIHPQTFIGQETTENYQWLSAVNIDARHVRKIIVFQPNPTSKLFKSKYYLFSYINNKKQKIADFDILIPPMGTIKIEWDLNILDVYDGFVSVAASALPTSNGKPILFNYFKDGSFTGMHG